MPELSMKCMPTVKNTASARMRSRVTPVLSFGTMVIFSSVTEK